jgi:hypothetical protein
LAAAACFPAAPYLFIHWLPPTTPCRQKGRQALDASAFWLTASSLGGKVLFFAGHPTVTLLLLLLLLQVDFELEFVFLAASFDLLIIITYPP